jgi:hypothetical protein
MAVCHPDCPVVNLPCLPMIVRIPHPQMAIFHVACRLSLLDIFLVVIKIQKLKFLTPKGKCLVRVPKKLVSTSKPAYLSESNESILQINLILTSPILVLTFYTYNVSNKKISS